MTLSAVCSACAQKLEVREFCTTALCLDQGSRCEACGTELFANENGVVVGYDPVTPEQLAEIRAKE